MDRMTSTPDKSYTPEAPSIIPLVNPKWTRSIEQNDLEPSLLGPDTTSSDEQVCLVCRKHASRYTCPRCEIPYCSLGCYKAHGSDSASCTEGFYQDRVHSILELENKAKSNDMQKILNRSHQALSEEFSDGMEDELDEEELLELADLLEQEGDMNEAELNLILSPKLRAAFMRAVKSGEASSAVKTWHPWWTSELAAAESVADQSTEDEMPTLDDRLLRIPSFHSLRPNSSSPLPPSIRCNAVEMLYNIALTLRLYHGVRNAVTSCGEASETLLAASPVLSKDERFTSVSDTLITCTAASTNALENEGDCNVSWHVLARDAAILCHPRHAAHAFLDAIDILSASIKEAKRKGDKETATKLRRAKKKLEYYLAWSRDTDALPRTAAEIREWIEEWNDFNGDERESLWIPSSSSTDERHSFQHTNRENNSTISPLITEVSSTLKKKG